MASGYWNSISKGIWKITEPIDALNALQDRESLPEFDSINFRIHILGPTHKAVILDLNEIFLAIDDDVELRNTFIKTVQEILKIQLN